MDACIQHSACLQWERKGRAEAAAEAVRAAAEYRLLTFTDAFMDAVGGDFLADIDESRLRTRHAADPEDLAQRLSRNRRTLAAQGALHRLYKRLAASDRLSEDERLLAEHARDLATLVVEREAGKACAFDAA